MGTKLPLSNAMMRHYVVGRITLIVGAMAVSAVLGSAQSLWVGAATGANTFNFSPTFFNGELTNLGSPNQLALYDHSATDSLKQLDLILAFVNAPASISITGVKAYSNVGNVNGSNNISAGSGTFTATSIAATNSAVYTNGSSQDAYTAIGTGAKGLGTPSENFSNFSGAEASIGITATSYYLYEYNLNSFASGFGDYGLLDLTFSGTLPQGAIGIGWGCGSLNNCNAQYNSVFTQSGFAGGGGSTPVPEPSSLILLGTVFLALLGIWQRKSKRSFVA
jgi:hypothetical protein